MVVLGPLCWPLRPLAAKAGIGVSAKTTLSAINAAETPAGYH